MREIKFRGKRVDNDEWEYGYLYHHAPPLQCFAGEQKSNGDTFIVKTGFADWNMIRPMDMFPVVPETVGQFTGLHDRTTDCFWCEGDILGAIEAEDKSRCIIMCDEVGFYRQGIREDCQVRLHPSDVYYWKKIGNIHEYPESSEAVR